jgi:NAD(P)-dependent dehydrogenase (short-subunit alcohol dehydrogenase family)
VVLIKEHIVMSEVAGKTIVITGASSGVGAAAARALHRQGAIVVPVGRSQQKTAAIATELGVTPYTVDFIRLDDVGQLAEKLLAHFPYIDVLVNNAGGIVPNDAPTVDGNEPIFQVNTLGPFLMAELLAKRLAASNGRVITTSSRSHVNAVISIDTLNQLDDGRTLRPHAVYARSKLVTGLLMREYGRQHPGILVADFHPGIIASDFGRYLGLLGSVLKVVGAPFLSTPEQGAKTLIYLTGTRDAINHQYFIRCQPAPGSPLLNDQALAHALWETCQQRTGLAD